METEPMSLPTLSDAKTHGGNTQCDLGTFLLLFPRSKRNMGPLIPIYGLWNKRYPRSVSLFGVAAERGV